MIEFKDPLDLELDSNVVRTAGAALYMQAQVLTLYSLGLEKKIPNRYPLRILDDAIKDYERMAQELEAEDHLSVIELVARITASVFDVGLSKHAGESMGSRNDGSQRELVARLLRVVSPIIDVLEGDHKSGRSITKRLIDSFEALDVGEVSELVKPAVRRSKYVRAHSVALIKYEFFLMRKVLDKAGFKPDERNSLYRVYALGSWDTTSRWKADSKKVLKLSSIDELEGKYKDIEDSLNQGDKDFAEKIMRELSARFRAARV